MRVTVCQLPDGPGLEHAWDGLVRHVQTEESELVLLPEMPFYDWFPAARQFSEETWRAALEAHDLWQGRLPTLIPALVLGSRPVERDGRRLNEGFLWNHQAGSLPKHQKYYLPDEEGYWEASWYERGNGSFCLFEAGPARVGFQICTDMWFMERSRQYGRKGAHLLAVPRSTPASTTDKWLAGGRAAAVVAGVWCLSSNRVSGSGSSGDQGGVGWIIDPDGAVVGTTDEEKPCLTIEVDLARAEEARETYPRYVPD